MITDAFKSSFCLRVAGVLLVFLLALACREARAESDKPQPQRLDGAATLTAVIERLGRPSDTSAAGGACGGIVIHDWIAENIRVVTLGDFVDTISEIR